VVTPGFHLSEVDPFVPYWADLVAGLSARHRVTVFPLRYPAAGRPYDAFGARVVPLGLGDTPLRRSPPLWTAAAGTIAGREGPFDVVLALRANEAGLVGAAAALAARIPLVISLTAGELVHLPDIRYGSRGVPVERLQVALAFRAASRVVVGCRAMADAAARQVGKARAGAVRLVPLGVSTERFRPASYRGPPRLLHVADMNAVKDQATLLSAFAVARRSITDLRLDLVGGGREAAALRRFARRLGVNDAVGWRGQLPHVLLPALYAGATAFALSSRHEGQAVVLAEAAASGLPIASTAVGMAPDLPSAGVSLAPVRRPDRLAAAILAAVERAGSPEAGEALRTVAETDYELERCAERLSAVLQGAARSRGA
jgi:glycosyltransferase involved in cell wall biosynthesis